MKKIKKNLFIIFRYKKIKSLINFYKRNYKNWIFLKQEKYLNHKMERSDKMCGIAGYKFIEKMKTYFKKILTKF